MSMLRTLSVAAVACAFAACEAFGPPALPTNQVETPPPEALPEIVDPAPVVTPPIAPAVQPLPPAPLQTQVTVTDQIQLDPPGVASLRDANAVSLRFGLTGAEGTHQLRLELQTPSGATYQVLEQAVTAEPHAEAVAEFELPIAGTMIDTYNLGGVWTAHLFFDGRALTTRTFELEQ